MPATGPTTQAGKAASSRNALKHGILSAAPLVTPQEAPGDWLSHLAQVRENLAPRDHLETCLAERVALLLWRMRRLACAEALAIAWSHDRIVNDYPKEEINGENPSPVSELAERLRQAKRMRALWNSIADLEDDQRLDGATAALLVDQALCVAAMPQGHAPPYLPLHGDWAQILWTGRGLRACLQWIVTDRGLNEEHFRSRCREHFENEVKMAEKIVEAVDRDLGWMACRRMLPPEPDMQLQIRYEAHLGRELSRTMKVFRDLQARSEVDATRHPTSDTRHPAGAPNGAIRIRSNQAADPLDGGYPKNCETNSAPTAQPSETSLSQHSTAPAQHSVTRSTAAAAGGNGENCETNSAPTEQPSEALLLQHSTCPDRVGITPAPQSSPSREAAASASHGNPSNRERKEAASPDFDDADAQAEFDLLSKNDPAFLRELQERAFISCVPLEALLGERHRQAKRAKVPILVPPKR